MLKINKTETSLKQNKTKAYISLTEIALEFFFKHTFHLATTKMTLSLYTYEGRLLGALGVLSYLKTWTHSYHAQKGLVV